MTGEGDMPDMSERQRLAERLEAMAVSEDYDGFLGEAETLREAAEWLRRDEALESEVQHWRSQRCETCQHGEPWPVVAGCLYCRHVQDHCDVMGNGCNAWEARP